MIKSVKIDRANQKTSSWKYCLLFLVFRIVHTFLFKNCLKAKLHLYASHQGSSMRFPKIFDSFLHVTEGLTNTSISGSSKNSVIE